MRHPFIFAVLACAGHAGAGVDVIDEQAGIWLNAIADGESQSLSLNVTAADPLPYDQSVAVNLPGDPIHAQASAAMYTYARSAINGLSINSDGAFSVDAAATNLSESYGISSSGFSIRFDIDHPAGYSAIGNLFKENPGLLGEDDSLVYARLELVEPISGTPQTLWHVSADVNNAPVNQSAILDGNSQYILTVQVLGWVQAAYGATQKSNSGSYQLDFALTEFGAGDADLDGDVDLSDLGALASHYGAATGSSWAHGDFDFDGDVDLADLGTLASNYGAGRGQFTADWTNLTAVPEPSSALLLATIAILRPGRTAKSSLRRRSRRASEILAAPQAQKSGEGGIERRPV